MPSKRDETIVIVNNGAGREPQATSKKKASSDNDFVKAVSVDLTVRAARNRLDQTSGLGGRAVG